MTTPTNLDRYRVIASAMPYVPKARERCSDFDAPHEQFKSGRWLFIAYASLAALYAAAVAVARI